MTNLTNISPTKLSHIQTALLQEFSTYPLSQAQVTRIVKSAQISRGAFYTYFADLPAAYRYLYQQVLAELHQPLTFENSLLVNYDPQLYFKVAADFTRQLQNSRYYDFIKLHLIYNEPFLKTPISSSLLLDSQHWQAMVLVHATIQDILLEPTKRERYLARLQTALLKQ
ncbi:TetR/AcrR family transcriptional regulator [Liquorilactobacillus sicerae]|uniref:TetR/AcrR family transcriptional regulator n=1 Tax=Liquorilactobacillus sicerae TaxID=1416943 RepID=UPI0024801D31|nr:TetR/AcrR family transcriptional regulator [Liquorilactobacillus sicerae]